MKPRAVVLLLSVLLVTGCMLVNVDVFKGVAPFEEVTLGGAGGAKVLVMDIEGLIHDRVSEDGLGLKEPETLLANLKERLDLAAGDHDVKALILKINSPGGLVNTCDIIHHEIIRYKNERGVKVVACLMDVAASGGYYVATSADYIVANPSCITGSIGVIALKFNLLGLMDKVGVAEESVKTGDKKDILSPLRPMTADERSLVRSILHDMQRRFVERITQARKDVTQDDLRTVSDARVLTAAQAKELHLIDELGYMEDALAAAKKLIGVDEAKVVAYIRPGTYAANVYSKPSAQADRGLSVLKGVLAGDASPRILYLWLP